MNNNYDLFIIGGGINGAGIARDAAGRGLNVLLCEQNDLASGTSSTSSKLIHGGLRYLEHYEFRLVKEALQEREKLLNIAPHIISPLTFVLPHNKLLRPAWMIRAGLFLYDHLDRHQTLPKSKKINLTQHTYGSSLNKTLKTGFSYSDCWVDDARLVVLNAQSAQDKGACILTRTEFISAQSNGSFWTIKLYNKQSDNYITVQAKAMINTAGPWINHVIKQLPITTPLSVSLVKGSHIVVPKIYDGDHAYILQHTDKRIVFVMPYQDQFNLIGTTDVNYSGSLSEITISKSETEYLCQVVNSYFSQKTAPTDVVWSYAGVRPLLQDEAENPSAMTRDYTIEINTDLQTPLINVFGGKITTYRKLSESVLTKLKPFFNISSSWTATEPLPGGDITSHLPSFTEMISNQYPELPTDLLNRYIKQYGSNITLVLKNCNKINELGLHFGANLYQNEVEYLITHEWVKTVDDLIWRRTKLGLFLSKQEINDLKNYISKRLKS